MSYGLPVLVSDIPANLEVNLPPERYFKCGSTADLKEKMENLLKQEMSEKEKSHFRKRIEEDYDWNKIAEQTIRVYRRTVEE